MKLERCSRKFFFTNLEASSRFEGKKRRKKRKKKDQRQDDFALEGNRQGGNKGIPFFIFLFEKRTVDVDRLHFFLFSVFFFRHVMRLDAEKTN